MRAGGGLRMVLHRERGDVQGVEALDHGVVEVVVAHLDAAEPGGRVEHALQRRLDGEAVVVRGDLDPAGGLVEHRLVDAAVSERQLVGAKAQGAPEQLVAEADSEERRAVAEHLLQERDVVVGCAGVARSVRVEHGIRSHRAQRFDGDALRHDVHVEAARGQVVQGGGLHAEVDDGDGADALALRLQRVALAATETTEERFAPAIGAESRTIVSWFESPSAGIVAGEDSGPHHADRAQPPGDRPGVDAADADDPLGGERVFQTALGAVVGHDPGGIAHDEAGDPDAVGLLVFVVHSGVADVRSRHEHDLARVGRIGDGLLISGHARREHGLAEGVPAGAVGLALVSGAVLQYQYRCRGLCRFAHCASLLLFAAMRPSIAWRKSAGSSGSTMRK